MGGWGKGAPAAIQFDRVAAAAAAAATRPPKSTYGGKGKGGKGSMEKPADTQVKNFTGVETAKYGVIGNEVGRGTFGRVFELPDYPNRVAKIMKRDSAYIHHSCNAIHEYEILETLNKVDHHHHCLSVYGKEALESEFIAIIIERLETNLFKADKSQIDIRSSTKSLLQQIQVFHSANFIHTDIKHKNIMVSKKGGLKIIDYGSGVFPDDPRPGVIVTKPFRPPEIYLKNEWGPSVDIWALAMTLGWLVADRKFFSVNFGDIPRYLSPCAGSYSPFRPDMSSKTLASTVALDDVISDPKLADLLKQMLHLDPAKRLTASEALQHPYCV